MSSFVLVHGAWHGGWCWERVATPLREHGHEVLTPTLKGLAERADELTPAVSLADHVQDALAALRSASEPAVLVGHSYSGLVVREAAAIATERVAAVVLLDAWVGPAGASLLSLAPDWFADGIRAAADAHGDGWRIPVPDPAAVGVTDPADAEWMRARLTEHPLRTLEDVTSAAPTAGVLRERAIVADAGAVEFAQLAAAQQIPVSRLEGGHDLMLTAPAALTEILLESA
jgi:pimeloyl-ACP methyl ester carboxylesterase